MNDLYIKGVDNEAYVGGYDFYHVRMGSGFLDAIECGVQLKEAIENDSRLEHGVRMLVSKKIAKRNVTLTFNIHGANKTEYMANKTAFEAMLQKGLVSIKGNDDNHPFFYHLVYTGKSVSYKHSYNGKFGIMTCQFVEPDPSKRTSEPSSHVRVIP